MDVWYWNKSKFEGLQSITDYLARSQSADGFKEYCALREKGLRKQALAALQRFIQETESWDKTRKRDFVDWVLTVNLNMQEIHGLISHDLEVKLVEPTLKSWMMAEPSNNRPLRWSNELVDVRRAIEIAKIDPIAKTNFARKVLSYADYETHELPWGFLGEDANETLAEIVEAIEYLEEVEKEKMTRGLLIKLRTIEVKLKKYLGDE